MPNLVDRPDYYIFIIWNWTPIHPLTILRVTFGLIISWEYVRQVAPVRRLKSGSNLSVKVKALIDWDEISCTILLLCSNTTVVVVCTVFTTVAPSHIANDANRIRTRGGFTVKIFCVCSTIWALMKRFSYLFTRFPQKEFHFDSVISKSYLLSLFLKFL